MSHNVTGTGRILATAEPSTKLTDREQRVDVVAADEILGQVDDRGLKGGLNKDGTFVSFVKISAVIIMTLIQGKSSSEVCHRPLRDGKLTFRRRFQPIGPP